MLRCYIQTGCQDPQCSVNYNSLPINHRIGRDIHREFSLRFNGADKTAEIIPTFTRINDLYSNCLIFLNLNEDCDVKGSNNAFLSRGPPHLILQIPYTACPMSRWLFPGSPPWLECPCRGSCTLGTWGHSCTSSHCPCRQTHPLHCRLCSWEPPVQNSLSSSLEGSLASL